MWGLYTGGWEEGSEGLGWAGNRVGYLKLYNSVYCRHNGSKVSTCNFPPFSNQRLWKKYIYQMLTIAYWSDDWTVICKQCPENSMQ